VYDYRTLITTRKSDQELREGFIIHGDRYCLSSKEE
jgi:hypothetical protein